jgi:hypothetical protein
VYHEKVIVLVENAVGIVAFAALVVIILVDYGSVSVDVANEHQP